MDREKFRRACLGAAAAVAWAAVPDSASGATVYTRVDFFHSLTMARFVALDHLTWLFTSELGALPTGITDRSFDTPVGQPTTFSSYALIGVGSGSGYSGISLTFSDSSVAIGRSWESLFPGFNEAQVADAVLTGGSNLSPFLDAIAQMSSTTTSMGVECAAVHFSDGVDMGTAIADFSPVPEPGCAVLCLGAFGIGVLRRRRPASALS